MKAARYIGKGEIAIVDEPSPTLASGGLIVKTKASGLCSGELMDWYMDRKIPHVLGHEVCGIVAESDDPRFPVGSSVFPHHHAPCMRCEMCQRRLFVHCEQWKRTKLAPGGMAEQFGVAPENLNDTLRTDDMRPQDAALIEPLACVHKAIAAAGVCPGEHRERLRFATVGLGVMGLMHMLVLGGVGYELSDRRIEWARSLHLDARRPDQAEPADVVFVCPGSKAAVEFALSIASPGAKIVLFAPLPPGENLSLPINDLYFKDIQLLTSYSCGPSDTAAAKRLIEARVVRAEQVVSHFITIDELPEAYQAMKRGDILKPMVMFD